MRLGIGVLAVAILLTGAFALPSKANHEQIVLRGLDMRVELPDVHQEENTTLPMRFTWAPADPYGRGVVLLCWNGRFDQARLTADVSTDTLCSSGANGSNVALGDASSAQFFPQEAGRYEAVVRRETLCEGTCFPPPPRHWNASNVVSVDVVDPCRLRLVSFRATGFHFPMLVGAPVICEVSLQGEFRVQSEDGSTIAIKGSGAGQTYLKYQSYVLRSAPVLRMNAGGIQPDVSFTIKSRLGRFVTSASAGAAHVLAVGPASVSLVVRNKVARVRVQSGRVVALGVGWHELSTEIPRFCGRKHPTIACLSKMRYRFFTMKRGTSLKARVLRAGQSATFKRRRGVITIVR